MYETIRDFYDFILEMQNPLIMEKISILGGGDRFMKEIFKLMDNKTQILQKK